MNINPELRLGTIAIAIQIISPMVGIISASE